ncbi:hypothetical protein [Natronorubrum sp. FCH18a]|uniref:hypothetical protein n=1 Tax=Natronorubrum sp. FCH18a TaxID=3447018 RepID=UPI003F51605B
MNTELIAALLQASAPFLVLFYGITAYFSLFNSDKAEKIDQAWEHAVQERKIPSTSDDFDILYNILSRRRGKAPKDKPDYLFFASGGLGVAADVYCEYETENEEGHNDLKKFVPLVLADKWVSEEKNAAQERIRTSVLVIAILVLFIGLAIDVSLITS